MGVVIVEEVWSISQRSGVCDRVLDLCGCGYGPVEEVVNMVMNLWIPQM